MVGDSQTAAGGVPCWRRCSRALGRAGSHSLQYFLTAVSEPGPGVPDFTVAGYVDGQRFVEYDGEAQQMRPLAPWMQAAQPEVWEQENRVHKVRQACFRGKVRSHLHLYNQSRGSRVFRCGHSKRPEPSPGPVVRDNHIGPPAPARTS
ncbi:H-2 class I histocompatibility antigen, Q9 alpha chain [Chelonia mydas]|uniref:H-2 class I histocompatibility antigen, Q9 alpha chain n=1 Tax=Chelonia mydas TaxID=8469 RepID=M7BUM4_CHEMY|nr:H-2 class I histocompatibility antigen, Q9 alpha chain [Chelonia mydas]